jgi:HK97 family phage major capsid protein
MLGQDYLLTEDERRAVTEFRAMSTTTTAGGFGIPVLIDPTVLVTNGTGLLGLLPYCTIEPVTNGVWKGVSAGNTEWSFDAEGAEVSDDASTFAQPSVTAHKAQALIPYSIEIEQDYPGFASEMTMLLRDGYEDLLAEKLMTGTGSSQPWGIFLTTTTTVNVTTDNTFGAPDIDKVWADLPEKFRARATWVMNVDVENDIRGFGSGTATSRFTVDQTAGGISLLNGRPVVLSDYAPTWTGTDGASILVLGDFSKFVVAQQVGMTVELVPHLTSTGNNRPNGTRGWYAYARVGSDKSVQNAFRKLKNITT